MRTVAIPRLRTEEGLVIGLAGALLVGGLTVGAGTPVPYLVIALPVVVGLAWWRPVAGFALLLGVALLVEEFEINTLPAGIEPWLLQSLPIFRNIKDYTSAPFGYVNVVELWLGLLTAIWLVRGLLARRLRVVPVACAGAWGLALGTLATAFVLGIWSGGDVKSALWEVRALGYLLGAAWLVPQLVERRSDVVLLLGAMVTALGAKAVQGLYRYFVVLHMQLDLRQTFMAHEDPVMFVPIFFLLLGLAHYRGAPLLRRILYVATPPMLLALVFTQRRVAYIGLVLCAVLFAVELSWPARRHLLRLVGPFVLVAAAYVALFAGSSSPLGRPIDRAMSLFDEDNTSNVYRLLELENLRYTIERHPQGLGFGHQYDIVRTLPELDFPLQYVIPHNNVMWMWVKTGTLGFIVLMFFFARYMAEGVWTYRHIGDPLLRVVAAMVPLAIANQLVASSFELQLVYGRNMLYLGTLLGLLGAIQAWTGVSSRGRRQPAWPRRPGAEA